jgi:acetylornithine deacetylase/succinyl-diaminopimelate desuccinylase family protein
MIERLLAAVDALADELVETLSRAIAIPSVTPAYPGESYEEHVGREGDVTRLLAEIYERAGCEIDRFGAEPGRENCVGILRGSGGGRSLVYNGHVDVVPPGPAEAWTGGDPWSGRVEDGKVFGRGACDMKGGVTAQAFAAVALREAGVRLRGDLILQAVVGEEMMEHELGTTACVERGYRADAAVVSEPSAPPFVLGVVPSTPGVLSFAVTVRGKTGHPGMRGDTIHPGGRGTEGGVNAIDKAMIVYDALRRLEEEWGLTKVHPLFRPGQFALHPGVFVGSPTGSLVPFFIPDRAVLDYVAIYHPDEEANAVRVEIERQVAGAAELDGWLREHPPSVEWKHHWPQSVVATDAPIVAATCAAHEEATSDPARLVGWSAVHDGAFLNRSGIPAIAYGPGDLRLAHAVDEHVAVEEVVRAARTYTVLAVRWCGT